MVVVPLASLPLKETSNHSRGPKTDGRHFTTQLPCPPTSARRAPTCPDHTLTVVRQASVSDSFSTSNATAPNTSPSEAQVMELWKNGCGCISLRA